MIAMSAENVLGSNRIKVQHTRMSQQFSKWLYILNEVYWGYNLYLLTTDSELPVRDIHPRTLRIREMQSKTLTTHKVAGLKLGITFNDFVV